MKKKKKKKTTKTEAEPKTAKNKKSPTRKKGVSFGTSPATAIDTKKQMHLEPPPSLQLPVDEEDDDDLHESEEDDAFDSSMAASPHINSSSDNVSVSAIPQRSPSLQKLILSPRERAMSASLAAAHSAGEVIPPRSPSRRKMRKSGRTGTMAVTARQVRRHSALEVVGDIRAQLASDGDCENANGTISAAPKTAFKQRELEQILSHMSVLPVLRDIEAEVAAATYSAREPPRSASSDSDSSNVTTTDKADRGILDYDCIAETQQMLLWGSQYRNIVSREGHAWVLASIDSDPQVAAAALGRRCRTSAGRTWHTAPTGVLRWFGNCRWYRGIRCGGYPHR
jgi:hypothetical protein